MGKGKGWERREHDEDWVSPHDYDQMWTHGPKMIVFWLTMVVLLIFGGFQVKRILLPAEEALRRDVYEESKSYRDGTIRDLDNLRLQWLAAEGVHQSAIADIARHRAADFPRDDLPERLRDWLAEVTR